MPLLASFVGSIAGALVSFFARFMSMQVALRLAAYGAWMVVFGTFLASVYVCISALYAAVRAMLDGPPGDGAWWHYLIMGIGMFIPTNAAAVVGCVSSVWIATSIYKIQKDGIHNYSK